MLRRARDWAALLALGGSLIAGPACATWPETPPAQPLAQARLRCALQVVPLNHRCKVVDFAELGTIEKRDWYYAFYATRWADRHGRHDRGFPLIFYRQGRSTLRFAFAVHDEPGLAGRWAMIAPARPIVVRRPEANYFGFTLKADKGPDEQRLYRLAMPRWANISVLYRSDADQARLDAAAPKDCALDGDGVYDWASFTLRIPLKSSRSGAPCGVMVATLEVQKNRLSVVQASVVPEAVFHQDGPPKP